MRYIVYGVGGVGSVMGTRLHQAGLDVVLIARGAHLEAMQRNGLHFLSPDEDLRVQVSAVDHPRALQFSADDVVVLTMKTQDTERALLELEAAGGSDAAVVSCQNGVESERLIARRFARVYSMLSGIQATYLEPGTVECGVQGNSGVVPVGRYPGGVDRTAEQIAADFNGARLYSKAEPAVMRLKYTKLLGNLRNGIQAVAGREEDTPAGKAFNARLRDEAIACLDAAGIAYATDDEYNDAVMRHVNFTPIPGRERAYSSTWQSLMRGAGSVEVDFLNGEIVLLGRLFGVPTPANAVVRRLVNSMAAAGEKPGRYSIADLEALAAGEPSAPVGSTGA